MPKRTVETTRKVAPHMMRAGFAPASFDKEKRTIDVIWGVGKKGLRYDWYEGTYYYEELSMDPAHCKMGRLTSGSAPFCDSHSSYSSRGVLGVIESAKLEKGEGTAVVRLANPDELSNVDSKDTIRKIESGIMQNISVGYQVLRYERQPQAEGETIPTYLATDWEPNEVSIVPVGFDESAVVRGKQELPGSPCVFVTQTDEEVRTMPEIEKKEEGQKPTNASAADQEKREKEIAENAKKEAREAEKTRQAEIRKRVGAAKLPEELALRMINEDQSVEQASEFIFAELAKRTESESTRTGVTATGGNPAQENSRKEAMTNALLHRASPGVVKLTDDGRNFRGMTLLEMARSSLEAGGIKSQGLGKMDLATRAFHSTSDFPSVLADVANKSLRKGYDESPRTFLSWAKQATLPDFKNVSRTQLGEAPALEVVGEDGEIKRGSITDGKESYSLATYAKILGISRKVIINDDLGAFTNIPSKFGAAAASLESDVVYAILTANAALADGVALFHSTHANLGTTGVPSVTTLGEFRKLMRKQTGLSGRTLNIMMKYIIAPAALETTLDQLLTQTTVPALDTSTNPFKGRLTPVIEPRLDASSASKYYGAADPNAIDTVEYGYLEGQEGVYTETRMGFDVDGMEVKARLDFAAKAIDHRGLVANF